MADEGSNGEYEIVKKESPPPALPANPFRPGENALSGLPPPSAFQIPPPPMSLTKERKTPPSGSDAVPLIIPKPVGAPAPLPPTISQSKPPPTAIAPSIPSPVATPAAPTPLAVAEALEEDASWTGWLRDTVQATPFLAKAAEQARKGMDKMILTLDPQMEEYMDASGSIELAIATDAESKIAGVKAGFAHSFAQVSARGLGAPGASSSEKIAHQPRGFDGGITGANERINLLRQSGLVDKKAAIVAVEGFVAELNHKCWADMVCCVIDDPANGINLVQYGQPTLITDEVLKYMQTHTPSDYPRLKYGYAVTCGDAIAHCSHARIDPKLWHQHEVGIERRALIEKASQALAHRYKIRLIEALMKQSKE